MDISEISTIQCADDTVYSDLPIKPRIVIDCPSAQVLGMLKFISTQDIYYLCRVDLNKVNKIISVLGLEEKLRFLFFETPLERINPVIATYLLCGCSKSDDYDQSVFGLVSRENDIDYADINSVGTAFLVDGRTIIVPTKYLVRSKRIQSMRQTTPTYGTVDNPIPVPPEFRKEDLKSYSLVNPSRIRKWLIM